MKLLISIIFFAVCIPAISYGAEAHKHKENIKPMGVAALSTELRELLSEEMQALEDAMISIIPAYNSGKWSEIETTAKKMEESYILKQSLTESQIKELHSKLPHAFIEKDQRFHYLAGMLAHAATSAKPELINFYFSEMNESCVNCHSIFATERFPALLPKEKKDAHSH